MACSRCAGAIKGLIASLGPGGVGLHTGNHAQWKGVSKMNVYSIDIKIVATAYVKAESEEAAKAVFEANLSEGNGGELPEGEAAIPVSGLAYDNPALPEWSISPAVTFYGADGEVDFDLVVEGV